MILKIRQDSDPVLRQPTEKVVDFDMELQKLIEDMVETMKKTNGIGLAAPQVGVSKKLITIEFSGEKELDIPEIPLTILCNPEIVETSKTEKNMVEGCLSFPGQEILIKRPSTVTVKGQDRYGNNVEIKANGLFARVLQHEIDHLNSVLFIDHMQEMDIVFIGTGTLGSLSLEALARDPQYKIKMVITGDNQVVSRKHKDKVSAIYEIARRHKLPILKTNNIRDQKVIEKIKATKPVLGILADFGQIIPKEILDLPKHGLINIHPSLLPKHRGPSPIQQTLLDGDKKTGVSLILTSEKMDAGGIISQVTFELTGKENATILKNYVEEVAANQLLNTIPYYLAGDLKPEPQDESKATYNRLFKKEDGFVDENTPKEVVERKIRAFSQWPKTYTIVKEKRVQLLSSHFNEKKELIIDLVKPEGKNQMSYEEFVRGYHTKLTFK